MGTEVHSAFATPTPNLASMESEQLIEREQLGAEGPELAEGREREKPRSLWQDAWRDLRGNWIFWVSSLVILFLLVVAIWPGLFTSTSPLACNLSNSLQGSSSAHPFGTDNQGCDIYSRTLHGARASVTVGVFATLGSVILGAVLGGLAGFFGGWWDAILSRITDIFFGIPLLLGAMVFLTAINSHSVWIVVAFLVILGWPQIARIARGSVITAKQQDYVTAARALGAGNTRMLVRHILPNAVAPIIVVGTIALGSYISLEATLSFLGVGLAPPTVSWGIDLSNAVQVFRNAPGTLFYPAAALSITVLAFIMLGDAVREALDPKLR
ncbi:ABC transporter permease [Streptacidiphilus sp. P02-A3a]|nr:ABC transporter permease [Streptacidiphilus sp. P02-A3a]